MHSEIVLISFPIFFSRLHRTQEEMKYFCKQDTESFIYLFFNIQVFRRITIFREVLIITCNGIALSYPPESNGFLMFARWKLKTINGTPVRF